LPRALRDIVGEAMKQQGEMEVVGDLESEGQLHAILAKRRPDVVIVAANGNGLSEALRQALVAGSRVLVLVEEARTAHLWRLAPQRVDLGELSAETVWRALA
jgi:DNA-binding NarL/FixJ family response regulator